MFPWNELRIATFRRNNLRSIKHPFLNKFLMKEEVRLERALHAKTKDRDLEFLF